MAGHAAPKSADFWRHRIADSWRRYISGTFRFVVAVTCKFYTRVKTFFVSRLEVRFLKNTINLWSEAWLKFWCIWLNWAPPRLTKNEGVVEKQLVKFVGTVSYPVYFLPNTVCQRFITCRVVLTKFYPKRLTIFRGLWSCQSACTLLKLRSVCESDQTCTASWLHCW